MSLRDSFCLGTFAHVFVRLSPCSLASSQGCLLAITTFVCKHSMIIFVSSPFSVQQVVQEKQTLSSKPVIGSSSSLTVGKPEQTQSLSSSAGHSALSTPSFTYSNSSAAIGNSPSSSKSSSRGRRATSSSSLSDKTTETSQSSSCSSRPQSRSWRRSDPPEPGIGLRRSQRLKETTGSCASNRYETFVWNPSCKTFSIPTLHVQTMWNQGTWSSHCMTLPS